MLPEGPRETGVAGLRNLPPSAGRAGAGSGSRLAPSLRDTSRTMSSAELGPAARPTVLPLGPDRGLSIDEVGSIRLLEDPAPAAA